MKSLINKYKHQVFVCLILLLTLKVLIPQLDGLVDSLAALKDANLAWIAAGIVAYFLGVPIITVQFMSLAIHKIYFWLTFQVEMAALFVNKLLPSGVGTISLNAYYLVKQKHTPSQATSVLAMNSLSSLVAYVFLIIIALTQSSLNLEGLEGDLSIPINLILFLLILLCGAIYTIYHSSSFRPRIIKAWRQFKSDFSSFSKRPKALAIATVCNGLGTSVNIFALFASAQAVGVDISLADALLAYTFGNIASALVPTPGGIGSAEAGIYSGLVLCGVAGPEAMVVTLLYRLISYWLPILPGYYFFWGLRKTVLADYDIRNKKTKQTSSITSVDV